VVAFSRSRSTKLAFAAGSLIVGLSASSVVLGGPLPTKAGGATVTAVRTVYGKSFVWTSSHTAVNLPGMSVTVSVPKGQHALLTITFSAATWCSVGSFSHEATCEVEALVDGVAAPPGAVDFDYSEQSTVPLNSTSAVARSMQFVAPQVGPGTHTVQMQYLVDDPDDSFNVYQRTLTVLRSAD
jgi:hypothetical protein